MLFDGYTASESELMLGIVCHVGANHKRIILKLSEQLEKFSYSTEVIKISSLMQEISKDVRINIDSSSEYVRIKSLMDAGNELRRRAENPDFMALLAVQEIARRRKQSGPGRKAYIIATLKRPEEIRCLRHVYGQGFHLLGIYANEAQRTRHLEELAMTNMQARELIVRDANEQDEYGQKTRNSFHLSDFFLEYNNEDFGVTEKNLQRYLDLLFGTLQNVPTPDEHAMFLAFSTALRSGDLSRQVGAVITNTSGDVIAMGANDAPRVGGGQYTTMDEIDNRDYLTGTDPNQLHWTKLIEEISYAFLKATSSHEGLTDDERDSMRKYFEKELGNTGIHDITEYSRAVHAEMAALLSCCRVSSNPIGGTLYVTTFPCHNCTKHIISSGIMRVVYIEPYPKSKAIDLFDEEITPSPGPKEHIPVAPKKVRFEAFVGVGPRRFVDLFSLNWGSGRPLERKDRKTGKRNEWQRVNQVLRLPLLPTTYLEREANLSIALTKTIGMPHE